MLLLDIRTLVFSNVLTSIVCTLVILLLWRQSRKRFGGMGLWVFDLAMQTIALLLIIPRGAIPDWMSMVVSNTLVIAGAMLGYMGLERFVGQKTRQLHNYALLAAFTSIHAYFTLVQPNLLARNLNLSMGLFIICFQCAWLLLRGVDVVARRLTFGVGLIFAVYCLVSIVRIINLFLWPQSTADFLQSGQFESYVLVSYQMLLVLLTYSLVLMVNKRLHMVATTQEEKFSKAFHSSPYAIMLTRLSDGQIEEINNGFSKIAGYRQDEVIGRTTVELHLWDREEDRATVVGELTRNGNVNGKEFQFRKKSGEKITGLFSAGIITINDRQYVLSSINDISERKRAEEEKEELQTQLRQAQKLEAVGTLAGGIAHEFNNLLQIINGYTHILLQDKNEDNPDSQDLKEILKAGERAAQLVHRLLLFSRKAATAKKSLDLNRELEQARQMLERTISQMIEIDVHPGRPLWMVQADPTQIEQTLVNLGTNAADAMPQGGKIVFETNNVTLNADYARVHPEVALGNYVLLTVADTGQGMDQETVQHIFDPFFTTREIGKGTGLGLASVYGIVSGHGGYITCHSEPGRGTTFKIYLPAAEGDDRSTMDI